jgi:hypothetical protein
MVSASLLDAMQSFVELQRNQRRFRLSQKMTTLATTHLA